jgi:hypothetical protein
MHCRYTKVRYVKQYLLCTVQFELTAVYTAATAAVIFTC